MTTNNDVALIEIPSKSIAKDLSDLLESTHGVLTKEELGRLDRLRGRLASFGKAEMVASLRKSEAAEALYDLQQEEDWKLLKDPQTGNPYRTWAEFREVLAMATGISTGTIGYYLRIVRLAREVLEIPPEKFASVGGLITVGHINKISIFDGRSSQHLSKIIRPRSARARDELEKYPGEDYAKKYQAYFDEIKHDYDDSSAINLPRSELKERANEVLGRPSFKAWIKPDDPLSYIIQIQYADHEDSSGSVVTGEIDETVIRFDGYVNPIIRGWLEDKLGIR